MKVLLLLVLVSLSYQISSAQTQGIRALQSNVGFVGRNVTTQCTSELINGGELVGDTLPIGLDDLGNPLDSIQFVADWITAYDCCDNDTARLVYREFEGFDMGGGRHTAFDTLVFLRPPIIDTLVCRYDSIGDSLVTQDGMYLKSLNDYCQQRYRVEVLDWEGVSIDADRVILCGVEDSIMLSASPGFTEYSWSTGQQSQEILIGSEDEIFVNAVDSNGCKSSSDTILVSPYNSFVDQDLCVVTYDQDLQKNVIQFEKPDTSGVQSYIIFADELGEFEAIDTVYVDSTASVVHTRSRPEIQSHLYKIGIVDSCGVYHESPIQGSLHRSILLQSGLGTSGEINLSWNSYEGRPVQKYEIWLNRESAEDTLIDQVSANNNSYVWRDAPVGDLKFYIRGIFRDTCIVEFSSSGRGLNEMIIAGVTSNFTDQVLTSDRSRDLDRVSIYPNPTRGKIEVTGVNESAASLAVFDSYGVEVFRLYELNTRIDLEHLASGYYIVQIKAHGTVLNWPLIKL